jgi:hypothetical protein
MSMPEAMPVDAEFATLAAAAEGIAPGTPPRPVDLPPGDSSFAFTLDNDLVKLVTLRRTGSSLDIRVRYATDVVLEEQRHTIRSAADPTIVADGLGLVVSWRAPLLEWLRWPLISRTRRY